MSISFFKRLLVFTVGFIIGFLTVYLYVYVGNIFESTRFINNSLKTWHVVNKWTENYNFWQQYQNIIVSQIDPDAFVYGTKENGSIILESEWLHNKVPITCIVFVEKLKLVTAIQNTWGKHCNHLFFFSQKLSDLDLSVINLGIKYTSSWQLLCEVMTYVWKKRNEIALHWTIFIKDDTIVIPENLRYMLGPLDFREPYYLGHAVVLWGSPYNVAQAGYVLSYEVLSRLMRKFNTSEKCAAGGKYWKKEDYYLGKHLISFNIYPLDTRDSEKKATFHGFSINTLLWGLVRPDSYYTKALYQPALHCCSNRTITFNVRETNQVPLISYILYRLRIFESGTYGNKPAPTPIPENEVWRSALREEFNLTVTDDISSDEYFKIWREKLKKFQGRAFYSNDVLKNNEILKIILGL